MALPTRLWLPDAMHELPTAVPAGQLSGLWPGSAGPAPVSAPTSGTTPLMRLRRRALLRADAGLPERPVLIEWFPRADLDAAEAERRKGACHVHLLRLHHVGLADARTAYAISESPAGVDLLTISRAAAGQLPAWWTVAVVAAAARGLDALHQHLHRRGGSAHGGIELSTLFVAWSGAVQLLAYAPPGHSTMPLVMAPEVRAAPRLTAPAADVYALGSILKALLPPAALARGALPRLVRRCLLPHAEERPALSALLAALEAVQWELETPLGRATALGEVLLRVCPREATVDLADAEWGGDSALLSFATLPATLFPLSPLSSGVVPLSPTWAMAPPEPVSLGDHTAPPPLPRPSSRSPMWLGGAALGLLLLGGAALWWSAGPPSSPPASRPAVAAPPSVPARAPELAPPAPASVPVAASPNSVPWGALRLQILRVTFEADRLRVLLRLTNATSRPLPAEISALSVGSGRAGQRPLPPAAPVPIGAGRTLTVTLDYPWPLPSQPPPSDLRLQLQ
jgi:hypothetical protein